MKKHNGIRWISVMLGLSALLMLAASGVSAKMEKETHPELSEQEMLIACADCHKESTPEIEKEWYDSVHGIAMIKCYQCHGTFETFKVTPTKADCAVCHVDQLEKCSKKKACWECHVPHVFKEKK